MQLLIVAELRFLIILAFLCAVLASDYSPICSTFFGTPSLLSCGRLLMSMKDRQDRFMGVHPSVDGTKPDFVSDAAWASRMMLPWVRSEAECNIALLSVLKPRQGLWYYTWTIDNLDRIAQSETGITASVGRNGVFRNCLIKGIGGFRQVGKPTMLLLTQPVYRTDSNL